MAGLTSGLVTWGFLRGLPRPLFSVASFSFGDTVPLSLMFAYLALVFPSYFLWWTWWGKKSQRQQSDWMQQQHGVEYTHTHRKGEGKKKNTTATELSDRSSKPHMTGLSPHTGSTFGSINPHLFPRSIFGRACPPPYFAAAHQ